jgi:hypothetical protein
MKESAMQNFARTVVMMATLVTGSAPLLADDALPADLAKAAREYDLAQVKCDRVALGRLLADDYTLVNGAAQVSTKAEFIADSVAPGFSIQPFEIEHVINKVWTDGAVLSGEVMLRGTSEGKPFASRMRFADVWRKREGRWQVVFTEVTRVPAASD